MIGRDRTLGSYRFKGIIDEVAIYNRDLQSDEITNHYNINKC
ncbi:MAG: hypothetical protein J4473_01085 [Candidatus Aenigmarchaeota archaeon]|nr:hypothetical protein [Candidatus Aenigmarchaeota archaeon]